MRLIELLTAVENIPNISINEAVTLKDEIIIKYQLYVRNKLKKIITSQDSDKDKYSALEAFLKDNWSLTKGTLLSYTAIYNNDATRAMCKAAKLICNFKNSKLDEKSLPFSPLQFLMPEVELISLIPNYSDLESVELLKLNNEDQRKFSQFESNLLKEKLEREQSLIDVQQEHIRKNRFIVKDEYCIPSITLEVILKTFVLNEDSSSLIPVSVILEDVNLRPYDFACVVFDDQIKKRTNQKIISHSDETLAVYNAMNKLSIAESDQNHFLGNLTELCKQLRFNDSHSGIGRHDNAGKGAYPAIIAFKDYYDALGYQLKEWQDEREFKEGFIYIKFNDNPAEGFSYAVKSKGTGIKQGVIKQEDIEGLFSKDSNVNDNNTGKENSRFYFEKAKNYKEEILKVVIAQGNASLEDEEKNKIPTELKNEIEKLLILSSDLSKNHNATTNLDTCIGTRRESLEKLISNPDQKQLLAQIATSHVFKVNLIKDLRSDLQQANNSLQEALNNADNYQGKDLLSISVKLLETFKVDFKIQNFNMLLDIIKGLAKDEVLALCEKDAYLEQFIGPIENNLENLTNFVLDCSEDNLKVLLESISSKSYITKLFDSAKTLVTVIDYASNNDKTNIIIKALDNNLHDIIKSGYYFGLVMEYLNEPQRTVVYNALKDNFKDIIKSGEDFSWAIRYLNESQKISAYNALKDNFKNIIKSGYDFGRALEYLNELQVTRICVALKDNLKDIITSGRDFGRAIQFLNESKIITVCTTILKNIINLEYNIGKVLEYLNAPQITAVCMTLKDNLKSVIKSGEDFRIALLYLNESQRSAVYNVLKDNLKDIIKSGYDFSCVLEYFNESQRTAVCIALKDNFKYILKSGHDFGWVLRYLNEIQRAIVYTALKDNFKDIIKSAKDFGYVIQYLNEPQKDAVYNALKNKLKKIIKSGEDFNHILEYLNESQKTAIYTALKNNLKDIIKSGEDFGYVIKYLNELQKTAVYTTLKDNFKKMITSERNFGAALQYLNGAQVAAACTALKNNLKNVIKSGEDFGTAVKYLNDIQIITVCTSLKDNVKDIIKSGEVFGITIRYLNESQRTAVYTALRYNLKDIIKSGYDFCCVLEWINTPQRVEVYTVLKDNLKNIIKSGKDFDCALQYLNDLQREVVYNILKDDLKNIIESGKDFKYCFKYVNETQKKQIDEIYKELIMPKKKITF